MQIHAFALLAALCASMHVSAQLLAWKCNCITNGVIDVSLVVSCCNSVSGNVNGDNCDIVSGTNVDTGLTGSFITCCFAGGQGAGCTNDASNAL
ncbi:hypothetical protein DFH07DRAFT_786370 [Mycena maculata]|uniref:Hydrophobin n=1 Tax=Mycena maculata TaxID=230809 RepID=A0AAD7KGX6_9AGAR|nr:hypothetical protein DFH07DRAFT_786370 [Mycena maculata]